MTIYIEEETPVSLDFDYRRVAEQVVNGAMEYVDFPFETEVSITITDEEGIAAINSQFRNISAPTDVLSFPMIDYEQAGDFAHIEENDDYFNPETGEAMLGDIVLCLPRILSQAEEYGHSVLREYAFLIAHSMMHLFGFDHMTETDAAVMEAKQREILEILNITRD